MRTGGKRIGNDGNFFEPTVLTDVPNDVRVMNEEPFGPLAVIAPFDDIDEVVEEANRLPYGLAALRLHALGKTANAVAAAVESRDDDDQPSSAWRCPRCRSAASRNRATARRAASEAIEAYLNTKFVTQAAM